jgi:arylesterase/paraoxonase
MTRLRWLLLVVLLVAAWLARTLWLAGVFRTLEPHFAGHCTEVAGIPGPEDLTIHPRTGVAYVSACDRFAVERGESPRGALYAYPLDSPSPSPVNLTSAELTDACPHGISLHVAPDGNDRLFVIVHRGERHSIEVYDLEGERLVHRESLADPLLVSPNDLAAVGREELYVTNDHGWPPGFARTLEEWLRLPLATVVRWDGARFSKVASGIRVANGIQAGADGRTLFVAGSLDRAVYVYERDDASGALAHREKVPVGTVPDNLELDAEGALWIGAHPKALELVRYRNGRAPRAPSQVVRAGREADGRWTVEEVFLDTGETLSASSVAAVHGDRLLIGGIYEPRLLDCRLP